MAGAAAAPAIGASAGRRSEMVNVALGIILGVISLLPSSCATPADKSATAPAGASAHSSLACSLSDAPLAEHQVRLLAVAFETATAIPVEPHIKDRSRAQERVVATCLLLDQPARAANYIERMENWRRGTGWADLAFYLARNGQADQARSWLERAADEAEMAADWRRDRIRVKIARVYALLGDAEPAGQFSQNLEFWESGKVAGAQAALDDDERFAQTLADLDGMIEATSFDPRLNALRSCAELFDRYYENPPRRAQLAQRVEQGMAPLPLFVQIELLCRLAEASLNHEDPPAALERVAAVRERIDSAEWPMRYLIPLTAQVAELRYRAGDVETARAEVAAARQLYAEHAEEMVDIYRARALHPLAEACQAMGDREAALAVYALALEAGVANPNSRPRAEDLSATCCSMALHGFKPDSELWARIERIGEGLGDPW